MTESLKGKVAWVTGGGSGMGLAGAIEFARAGAHVVISGRNAKTNEAAIAQLKQAGSAELVALDVADRAAVARAAEGILKRHGKVAGKISYDADSVFDWSLSTQDFSLTDLENQSCERSSS